MRLLFLVHWIVAIHSLCIPIRPLNVKFHSQLSIYSIGYGSFHNGNNKLHPHKYCLLPSSKESSLSTEESSSNLGTPSPTQYFSPIPLQAVLIDNDVANSSSSPKKELNSESIAVLGLLFLVTCLCSLDRVAMSVAVIPMGNELGYSEQVKGAVSTIFSLGYLCGMLPAGVIGSFSSPKNVLSAGVLFWSLAQMVSPTAAEYSLPALLASRFFMGMSESVTVPTVQNFVARLVPDANKSIALGIILSGLQVGNIFAFQLSPYFLNSFGWDGLLQAFGAVGFVWLALWLPFARENDSSEGAVPTDADSDVVNGVSQKPALIADTVVSDINCGRIASLEDSFESAGPPVSITAITDVSTPPSLADKVLGGLKDAPWGTMLASKEVQSIAVAHAVQNFGLYINLAWLPSFFNQKYHLSVDDSSLSSVLPWVAGAIMGPLAGSLADKWIADGVDKTFVRKFFQSFALVVPAATLLSLSMAPSDLSSENAVAYFVLAVASAAVCVAGFSSSVQDVCASSKYVGIVYSLTALPAVLVGSLGVYATGVVLDRTHSFTLVFQGMAVVYLLGALFYALNYEAKKVIE